MARQPRFNYIITIHNKADLIGGVLDGIEIAAGKNSVIYPVLDGCTDNTEVVIDGWSKKHPGVLVKKVFVNDVHELLSINAGLKAAKHIGEGYNIILQDDVVLQDSGLERKVLALYQKVGPKLGYISFRLGANLTTNALKSTDSVPLTDYVENAYGHGLPNAVALLPGQFCYRDIPIKSPVCVPFLLIRNVGTYEEKLAPYAHDDVDYAIRSIRAGFKNGVFNIKFESKIEWGGTRQKTHPRMNAIITRNMDAIRSWFPKEIEKMGQEKTTPAPIEIAGTSSIAERKRAQASWEKNQKILEEFSKKDVRPLERVSKFIKGAIKYSSKKTGESGIAPSQSRTISAVSNGLREVATRIHKHWYSRRQALFATDLSFTAAVRSFPDPNDLYAYMHHYFHHFCPATIQAHRAYFARNRRGFGEDAFQAMWWILIREFKPNHCLEIGVYRGQTVSLFALVAKINDIPCEVHALSPFLPVGHWNYPLSLDYQKDVRENFAHFGLAKPILVKAYSNKKRGINYITRTKWDLIYIDGDHAEDIVLADYQHCLKSLAKGGLLVFDDSSLGTAFRSPAFASAGQPGPTQIVQQYAMKEKRLEFLGAVGHNTVFRRR